MRKFAGQAAIHAESVLLATRLLLSDAALSASDV
jgi:hypothetical protein